jgi:hypothetical protein
MKLKAIPYQSGYIFVDENAEIKEGDYVWYHHPKQDFDMASIHKVINPNYSLHEPSHRVHFDTGFGVIEGCKKIIAQTPNLNLEGIPFIELEEDCSLEKAKQFAEKYFDSLHAEYPKGGLVSIKELISVLLVGVECGYKFGTKAQPKQYTEEQVRFAIKAAKGLVVPLQNKSADDIVRSLQPKIESIEVETEWKGNSTNQGFEMKGLSTDGEWFYKTYQKDGKTYLKVKK